MNQVKSLRPNYQNIITKMNVEGWSGGAYKREEKFVHSFGREAYRKEATQEDLELDGRVVPRRMLNMKDGRAWNRLIWLSISKSGGLLRTRQWTFGLRKIRGISWLTGELWASQEGFFATELVNYKITVDSVDASFLRNWCM